MSGPANFQKIKSSNAVKELCYNKKKRGNNMLTIKHQKRDPSVPPLSISGLFDLSCIGHNDDVVVNQKELDFTRRELKQDRKTLAKAFLALGIKSGDIILWKENTYNPELNNGYWLCVDSYNYHNVNWHGTLQFCNYFLIVQKRHLLMM